MRRILISFLSLLVIIALALPSASALAATKSSSLSITSPKGGQTVAAGEVEIKFKASNFKLDAKSIGGANKPGVGHIVLSIDGAQVTRTAKTSVKVTGLTVGQHTIVAELANNDQSPLSPPISATIQFVYQMPAKLGKVSKDALPVPLAPIPTPIPTPTSAPLPTATSIPTPRPLPANTPTPTAVPTPTFTPPPPTAPATSTPRPTATPEPPKPLSLAGSITNLAQAMIPRGTLEQYDFQDRQEAPVVSRITVSSRSTDGTVAITGAAGAIPVTDRQRNMARIAAVEWGTQACVPIGQDGSFATRLQAGPGNTIIVAAVEQGACQAQWGSGSAGVMLRVPEGVEYTSPALPFSVSGFNNAWHWIASGQLAGSAPFIQFTLPDGPQQPCNLPRLQVYRLFDRLGQYAGEVNVNVHGPPLTPTGLPIETDEGVNQYWALVRPTVPGIPTSQQCLSMNTRFDLTGWAAGLEAGWYRARIVFDTLRPNGEEYRDIGQFRGPSQSPLGGELEQNTGIGYLPLMKVGDAQPPRIPATLLNEIPSWGSGGIRGIVANEDEGRFALGSRRATQTSFIASPRDPLSGRRVRYLLEPYLPTLAYTGFGFMVPQVPLIAMNDSSLGTLSVSLTRPDGRTVSLANNAPFTQSFLAGSTSNGYPVALSFAGPGRTFGLTTGLDALNVDFDQYGLHKVTLNGTVKSLWGQDLAIQGTYNIWVAEPLDLKLGMFEGTPMAVGDEFSPVVVVEPGVAAQVSLRVDHFVDGDAAKRQTFQVSGKANRFGYFVADRTWRPEAHGEYIFTLTASYTDPADGTLWMASRAGASIVATPNTPLIAHGQKNGELANIGRDSTLRTWFFTRTFDPNCGEAACDPIGNRHARSVGSYPFFRGDVAWLADMSPIHPSVTLEDQTSILGPLAPQVAESFTWCGETFCAESRDMKKLSIHTTAGNGGQQRPDRIDSWAYWYTSSVRADGIHVHAAVSEVTAAHNHWYGHDSYNCQIGLTCFGSWDFLGLGDREGDEEGDVKLLFGGAVIKSARGNQFVPYASMAVITPGAVQTGPNTYSLKDPKGNRICPPYQGAAGGLATCGPLLTVQGLPYDLFITPTGTRPGSVLEVGDSFVFSGQAWPTLDVGVTVTVTSPSGQVQTFTSRASQVGYIDSKGKTFRVTEPGVYTVHIAAIQDRAVPSTGLVPNPPVLADGKTVLTQYGYRAPLSAILGSPDSIYRFVVASPRDDVAVSTLITLNTIRPGVSPARTPSTIVLTFDLPAAADSLRFTVAIAGLIIRDEAIAGNSNRVRVELNADTLYSQGFTNVVLGADSIEVTVTGRINGQWFAKVVNLRGSSPLGGKPATVQ